MEMQFWTEQRETLRRLLAEGDVEHFLEWPLVIGTMFFPLKAEELEYLKALANWEFIRALISDPGVGGRDNGNIVHHAYSIFMFENAMGYQLVGQGKILEIGGGYGNFCRLVFKRGFAGTYVIHDLPEFAQLQQWYLSRTLGREEQNKITHATSLPAEADLIVGLWSLSEMPFAARDQIKALRPRYFLIGYQQEFYGLDNIEYFKTWTKDTTYVWKHMPIPHIKDNYYLFGKRK